MGNRLWSDLQDSAARRYWFDLDSTPGICQPGVGSIQLLGQEPQYPGTVFRTPATAALQLQGILVGNDVPLRPAQAALSFTNSVVGLQTIRLISPSLESPVESPDVSFAPTILFINTITPAPAALALIGYNHSLSEGGDIGFAFPPTAQLTLFGYQYTRVIPPAPPEEGVDGQLGTATLIGLAPELVTSLTIEPEVGALSMGELSQRVERGFIWLDDDPAPPLLWT